MESKKPDEDEKTPQPEPPIKSDLVVEDFEDSIPQDLGSKFEDVKPGKVSEDTMELAKDLENL